MTIQKLMKNRVQAPTELTISKEKGYRKLKKFSLLLKEYKLGAQAMSIGRRFHNGTTLTEKENR